MNGRNPFVVDTNVPIVANRKDNESLRCANACAKALRSITAAGTVVLDNGEIIFTQYRGYLNFSGQPGVGDYFFKWLVNNRARSDLVAHVTIATDDSRGYQAFPVDPDLAQFDLSDRIFVAVSLTHGQDPPILNATDSDWWLFGEALQRNGITVRNLCME